MTTKSSRIERIGTVLNKSETAFLLLNRLENEKYATERHLIYK